MTNFPFHHMPTVKEIAYWVNNNASTISPADQGCDGYTLWQTDKDYLYIWITSIVDYDLNYFFLVDIRIAYGDDIGSRETRQYLNVAVGTGYGDVPFYVLQDNLCLFSDPPPTHRKFMSKGLKDFTRFINNQSEYLYRVVD